jgi:hypothetical protein
MSHVRERLIVVGIDGSDESSAAFRLAVRQAGLTGAIDPVNGWQTPVTHRYACAPFTDRHFAGWPSESLHHRIRDVRATARSLTASESPSPRPAFW